MRATPKPFVLCFAVVVALLGGGTASKVVQAEEAAAPEVENVAEAPRPDAYYQRPRPRPDSLTHPDRRCTADKAHCISVQTYVADVCRTMEIAATGAGLDVGFFARLLWRESLFDATAVSPAGAQGIAQFMPATARRRGLNDPFNPASAMMASATYLADLTDQFGNLGLAAAAYNAGEARVDAFLTKDRTLPRETRRYVHAITGISPLAWRDTPPDDIDLKLDGDTPFQQSCVEMAANRGIKTFKAPAASMPWAVIVTAHRSKDIAQHRYVQLARRKTLLRDHSVDYVYMRLPGRHGSQHTAQIGRDSRNEADALCASFRKSAIPCIVLRN